MRARCSTCAMISRPMNILFLIYNLDGGGAERVCASLCDQWAKSGHNVEILCTSFTKGDAYQTVAKVVAPFRGKTRFFKKRATLIAKAREFRPTIIVSFLFGPSFWASVLSRKLRVPFICSERNDPRRLPHGFFKQRLRNRVYRKARKVVCQTEEAKNYVERAIRANGFVIFNPLRPMPRVTPTVEKPWICLGRLEPQKNYPLLINAFARLVKNEQTTSSLLIYGKGGLEQTLQAQIQALGTQERIRLMGWSDAEKAIGNAKGFILSSDFEGMPNALGEALASGLPCISTDCPIGGPRIFAKVAENIILVPVNNEEALYKAIIQVEGNYHKAVQCAAEDAILMQKAFSIEKIADQWLNLFQKTIEEDHR